MPQLTAHAPDISCEGCANAIRRALGNVNGVQSVKVDVPRREVQVEYDEATVESKEVLDKLAQAGYDSNLKG